MKPTGRALRHALAAALCLKPWAVFNATRVLNRLAVVKDSEPTTARTAGLGLLAILATVPHRWERAPRGERVDRDERVLARLSLLAAMKVRHVERTGGALPYCFRIFEQDNLTLAVAVELLLEQSGDPNVMHQFAHPADDPFAVDRHAVKLVLHAMEPLPRVALTIKAANGATIGLTFATPGDLLTPPASRLALRVGLDARAIVLLSRLLAGDPSAEDALTTESAATPVQYAPTEAQFLDGAVNVPPRRTYRRRAS